MSVRKQVSKILGHTILTDKHGARWDDAFKALQVEGRVTNKHLLKLIVLLLKREEIVEKNLEMKHEVSREEHEVLMGLLKNPPFKEVDGEKNRAWVLKLDKRIKKLETKKVQPPKEVKKAPKPTKKTTKNG